MKNIINDLGTNTPLHELEAIVNINDAVEEIRDLMETWDANNSLDELIEPLENGPYGATHIYREKNITLYLIVKEDSISIVDAKATSAIAA